MNFKFWIDNETKENIIELSEHIRVEHMLFTIILLMLAIAYVYVKKK